MSKCSRAIKSGSTENGSGEGYKTCELAMIPSVADEEQLSVQIDWGTLCGATREQKVPVSLFVLCKTIAEDEGGSLFLNATVVQRVQVGNVPVSTQGTAPEESTAKQLKALVFDIGLKGPFPGGEVKRRRDADVTGVRAPPAADVTGVRAPPASAQLCAQTFDVLSAPIDVSSIWHRCER